MKKTSILSFLFVAFLITYSVISQPNEVKEANIDQKSIKEEQPNKNVEKNETLNQETLTGTWYWESSNASNNMELYLTQNGTSANGKHCSSFLNGTKLDCVNNGEANSITLNMVSNNVFEGTLQSNFSDAVINIRLTLDPVNETIYFQQLNLPEGEFYIPNNVIMRLAQE